MSLNKRVRDFARAQTDVQIAYINAEVENKRLRGLLSDLWKRTHIVLLKHELEDFKDRMDDLEVET